MDFLPLPIAGRVCEDANKVLFSVRFVGQSVVSDDPEGEFFGGDERAGGP